MKKAFELLMIPVIAFFAFNLFFKNTAQADARKAYDDYINGKAVFIDVREKDEVDEGMIKGALWIPLSELKANPEATVSKVKELTKGKEIYVYCRSGNRSGKFINTLSEHGIKAINMGGFGDLVSEKLPTQPHP